MLQQYSMQSFLSRKTKTTYCEYLLKSKVSTYLHYSTSSQKAANFPSFRLVKDASNLLVSNIQATQ